MLRLKTSILYVILFYFFTTILFFLQPAPLFMGIGKSFIDYLVAPFISTVKPQFIRSAHSRVVFFIWTIIVHFLWIKKIDPIYKIPSFSKLRQFTNYLKGIASALLLLTIPQLVFLFITSTPYSIEIQYEKILINLPVIALLSFFTSTGEELVFRQYILKKLQPFGTHKAVIIQALLFGLAHYNNHTAWGRVCTTALAGAFFGYVSVYTNSLAWCIGLHSGIHLANLKTYTGPFFNLDSYKDFIFIIDTNFGGLIGQLPLLLTTVYIGFLVSKKEWRKENKALYN